jgi:hypothetical protein
MHARLKTMYSKQALRFEAEIREEARRQEKLKNLKTSDRREGRQRGKSEVMQYIGKKNARHEKV